MIAALIITIGVFPNGFDPYTTTFPALFLAMLLCSLWIWMYFFSLLFVRRQIGRANVLVG